MVETIQVVSGDPEAQQPAPQAPANVIQTHMGTQTPVVPAPDAPVDKFGGDYDKLMTSYNELQVKLGTPVVAPAAPVTPGTPPAATPGNKNDFSNYETEFADSGALSDKSYADLNTQGYSKEMVDQYIAGATAQSDANSRAMLDAAGGQDAFDAMAGWAKANYNETQLKSYNDAIDSGDSGKATMALAALKADYGTAHGTDGNLLSGNKGPVGVEKFLSHAQVTEAMNDPRYEKDPAYRQEVYDRLSQSDIMQGGKF